MNKLINYLLYAGVEKEEYDAIRSNIDESNRTNLRAFSGISSAFLVFMTFLSFVDPNAMANRLFYAIFAIAMLVVFLISSLLYKIIPRAINPCVYVFLGVLFLFGITLTTLGSPEHQCTTLVAFVLALPVLVQVRPIFMNIVIIAAAVTYTLIGAKFKDPVIYSLDVGNLWIFSAASCIISTFMTKVKTERFVFERKSILVSNTDLLTGLNNRNCYEQKLAVYPDKCSSSLTCVYADVNGLHELNNTKGHKAGDIMLKACAAAIEKQFGHENSYRIGGDEFAAFIIDGDTEKTAEKVRKLTSEIEGKGYHMSVGFEKAEIPMESIEALIKAAEVKMYDEKRRYYENVGGERTNARR